MARLEDIPKDEQKRLHLARQCSWRWQLLLLLYCCVSDLVEVLVVVPCFSVSSAEHLVVMDIALPVGAA